MILWSQLMVIKLKVLWKFQNIIMMSTDEFINFTVNRYDQDLTFRVKPNIVEGEDNLGNKISKRMVGIKLGAYNNEVNHVKLGPAKALFYAVNEVYYVSTSSLKYIGSMIVGNG